MASEGSGSPYPYEDDLDEDQLGTIGQKGKREYDLDLTYITGNVIATSMPGESITAFYRNSFEDVKQFLHKVYNSLSRALSLSSDTSRQSAKSCIPS